MLSVAVAVVVELVFLPPHALFSTEVDKYVYFRRSFMFLSEEPVCFFQEKARLALFSCSEEHGESVDPPRDHAPVGAYTHSRTHARASCTYIWMYGCVYYVLKVVLCRVLVEYF